MPKRLPTAAVREDINPMDSLAHELLAISLKDAATTDEEFSLLLNVLPRDTLNRLPMTLYSRNERKMINEERVRRCRAGSVTSDSTTSSVQDAQPSQDDVTSEGIADSEIGTPQSFYRFPEHHDQVVAQVRDVDFQLEEKEPNSRWSTNVIGTFRCSNEGCKNKWTSYHVATEIRKYGYTTSNFRYDAVVFNQRCCLCDALGTFTLDVDSYVDRVVRRLKVWKRDFVPYTQRRWVNKQIPHAQKHCEGCRLGRCPWLKRNKVGLTLTSRIV